MNLKKTTKPESIAQKIYEEKIQGKPPGEKLPNELQLAQDMEVSRTTLREAIRILTSQGILEVQHGKGTFITKNKLIESQSIENNNKISISLKDLFEMRLIIEPQIAALACKRATDEEIQAICTQNEKVINKIKQIQQRLKTDKSKIQSQLEKSWEEVSWEEEDKKFHDLIAKAAHNQLTDQFFPWIHDSIHQAVKQVIYEGIYEKELSDNTIRDHNLIVEFLKKRDSIGARNAMEIHIHNGILTLQLNKNADEPIF